MEGTFLTTDERAWLSKRQPAGVTLFKRNLSDTDQIKNLVEEIQSTRHPSLPPLIIAIDQEGGRVSRMPEDFPNEGPCLNLYPGIEKASLNNLQEYGKKVGRALREHGINTNFAPVCDILTNEENTAIGDRAFGTYAQEVIPRAQAFMQGLQQAGSFSCLKHFPGQGDADADTHLRPSSIKHSMDILDSRELTPFKTLAPGAEMIMISHCIYPALDSEPASLSKKVITHLLRQKWGYKGIIVSDDMNMKALPQEKLGWSGAIVKAAQAGSNLILVCRDLDRCEMAYEALHRASESSIELASHIKTSTKRILDLRLKLSIQGH